MIVGYILRRLALACIVGLTIGSCTELPLSHAASQHSAARIVYVAFGDGITLGVGADDPATQSYPALLARHLPRGAHYLNLAINRSTLGDALGAQLPAALNAHATLATVWLGGGDVFSGTPSATYKAELDRLLTALQHRHVRVFISTEPDLRLVPSFASQDSDGTLAKLGRAYDAVIVAEAARYGATVIDLYAATQSIWGHPELLSSATNSPNTRGYAAISRVFYRVMHAQGAL